MGDPTTVNQTATTVNAVIRLLIFNAAMTAAKTAMVAAAPFLGWPIISQVVNFLLDKIGTFIYTALAQNSTFLVIDFQITAEKNAYMKAEADLRAAHLKGDPNAIKAATDAFSKALASLVHYDGSASI